MYYMAINIACLPFSSEVTQHRRRPRRLFCGYVQDEENFFSPFNNESTVYFLTEPPSFVKPNEKLMECIYYVNSSSFHAGRPTACLA